MRFLLLLVLAVPLCVSAAEGKPPRTASAGKADAEAAFARQLATAPSASGAEPAVRGAYVWGGRADEQYKPFFQWELRVLAGNQALEQLRGRTITLLPDGGDAKVGEWVDLGHFDAGESRDVALRQNCPAFASYRLELTWKSGKATYVAADRTAVPVAASTFADMAYLVTTGYQHAAEENKAEQQKRGGKGFPVSWWLWNIGGAPATDVVQTVRFLDGSGKEVQRETLTLSEAVPAGARLEQVLTLKTKPKDYQVISVSAMCAIPVTASGGGTGGFTSAKEVEIADLLVKAGELSVRVRNGLARDLSGLVVTVTLLDAAGKAVEAVPLSVGDLASGGETAAKAAVQATAFAGYELGWESSKPVRAAPTTAASTPQSITVDGLTFTVQQQVAADGNLYVKGQLQNNREASVPALTVTFTAHSGATTTDASWSAESLPVGEAISVALTFPGLSTCDGLALVWQTR